MHSVPRRPDCRNLVGPSLARYTVGPMAVSAVSSSCPCGFAETVSSPRHQTARTGFPHAALSLHGRVMTRRLIRSKRPIPAGSVDLRDHPPPAVSRSVRILCFPSNARRVSWAWLGPPAPRSDRTRRKSKPVAERLPWPRSRSGSCPFGRRSRAASLPESLVHRLQPHACRPYPSTRTTRSSAYRAYPRASTALVTSGPLQHRIHLPRAGM